MLADFLYFWLMWIVELHLIAIPLTLLVVGLCLLAEAVIPILRHRWSDGRMTRGSKERIAEIRSIGQQARREMEQQQFEFLNTVSQLKGR